MEKIKVGPFEFQPGRNLDFECKPERDMVWTGFQVIDSEEKDLEPVNGLTLEHAAIDGELIDRAGTVIFKGQTARVRMVNGTDRTFNLAIVFALEDQPQSVNGALTENSASVTGDNEAIQTLLGADPALLDAEAVLVGMAALVPDQPAESDQPAEPTQLDKPVDPQ